MDKTINVTIENTPEEVAEMLFNLNDQEVAAVFALWAKKFDEEYVRRKEAGKPIWIFDLPHFFLHVVKHLDEDGMRIVRDMYAMQLYHLAGMPYKKHLTDLH